jgi:hypothetical protein
MQENLNYSTPYKCWWRNTLSTNEQREYGKKYLLNFEYSALFNNPYVKAAYINKLIEKMWRIHYNVDELELTIGLIPTI